MGSQAVARGALAVLRQWLPSDLASYLTAYPDLAGQVAQPQSWLTVPPAALETVADQLPAVTVWGGKTLSAARNGSGYDAIFELSVAAVDSHDDWDTTAAFAEAFDTCLTRTLLAHPDLGGACDDLQWQGSDPTVTRDRQRAVVVTTWRAWVSEVYGRPAGPYALPPAMDGTGLGVAVAPPGLGAATSVHVEHVTRQ